LPTNECKTCLVEFMFTVYTLEELNPHSGFMLQVRCQ
jgi:hypothetical protein